MSTTVRRNVEQLLGRAGFAALFCLAVSIVALATGGSDIVLGAGVMLLVGILCAGLLALSWRHHHPMISWAVFAFPSAVLALGAIDLVLGAPLASGTVSVLSVVAVLVGCGGLGFFGSLYLLRAKLLRWLGA